MAKNYQKKCYWSKRSPHGLWSTWEGRESILMTEIILHCSLTHPTNWGKGLSKLKEDFATNQELASYS